MSEKVNIYLNEGICFPVNESGKRSSLEFNQLCFLSSISNTNESEEVSIIKNTSLSSWRKIYHRHVQKNIEICLKSKEICYDICENGMKFVHENMMFLRNGQEMKLKDTIKNINEKIFFSGEFIGEGYMENENEYKYELSIPYEKKLYKNEDGLSLINEWIKKGYMTPDTRESFEYLLDSDNKEKIVKSVRNKIFVIFGINSEVGILENLLELGATVIAIARPNASKWEKLVKKVKKSKGKLIIPLRKKQGECENLSETFQNAGCDIIKETPEIYYWLKDLYPDESLVLVNSTYADGKLFVKLSVGVDFILKNLLENRKKIIICFFGSPAMCYNVKEETYNAMQLRLEKDLCLKKILYYCCSCNDNCLKKNGYHVDNSFLCNGLVNSQGPGYALAKQLQIWRTILHRKNDVASHNITLSTFSKSVLREKKIMYFLKGLIYFNIKVFLPSTARALNTGLLLYDITVSEEITEKEEFENPIRCFNTNSMHGGIWNAGYEFNSLVIISVLLYILKKYRSFFCIGSMALLTILLLIFIIVLVIIIVVIK